MKIQSFLTMLILVLFNIATAFAGEITCWFPPGSDAAKSKAITDALSKESGLTISPRIATGYPEILKAFSESKATLAYVGSFASAIMKARDLGSPLLQKIDGKEHYSGVMIFPKGGDAAKILKENAGDISFAIGASSGETSAKAATAGKASIGVKDHMAAANAIKAGKAKAGFVKNFWWDSNKDKFPELESYNVPGVSEQKNPDNILWASKTVSADDKGKVIKASKASKDAFGATELKDFDATDLSFTLSQMKKATIDPKTYSW